MMHYVDTVVTLVDANNKPLREYEPVKQNNGRKSKVVMPFDTEYKLFVKNTSDKRIRLEIDIDGTIVSGNGIVVDAWENGCYIERFVETNKKFKFVKASNEAVGDPTSRENGIIKVRVAKEKDRPKVVPVEKIVEHHHHHHNNWYGQPYWLGGQMYGSAGLNQSIMNSQGLVGSSLNDSLTPESKFDSSECINSFFSQTGPQQPMLGNITTTAFNLPSPPMGEAGATIEGGISGQVFGSTDWVGDADISYFTFQVSGKDLKNDPEYQAFLKLKEKFGE